MTEQTIAFAEVAVHRDLQPRISIDQSVVEEYAEVLRGDARALPPIDVFLVGTEETPYVVDGYHRWHAHRLVESEWLRCNVVGRGTLDEGRWVSTRSNRTHGLRRSNEDKRAAVLSALATEIGQEQSNRVIAEHVGVSADLVSAVRSEWEASLSGKRVEVTESTPGGAKPRKRRGRDGKLYPVRPEPVAVVDAAPIMPPHASDETVREYLNTSDTKAVQRIREPSRGAGFWQTKTDADINAIVEEVGGRILLDLAVVEGGESLRHQINMRPEAAKWLASALSAAVESLE